MDLNEAKRALKAAWPNIVSEVRLVLGGELHYQAVIYHCLRNAGCPATQIGMNVKQWIDEPITELFKAWDVRKNEAFRGGFETIPDIVLFAPEVAGDWRRRSYTNTLKHMLCAIEVKASERAKSRLSVNEITRDIDKLAAHRDEIVHRGGAMHPVMMVIDVAPDESERMHLDTVSKCSDFASSQSVTWCYASRLSEKLNFAA